MYPELTQVIAFKTYSISCV